MRDKLNEAKAAEQRARVSSDALHSKVVQAEQRAAAIERELMLHRSAQSVPGIRRSRSSLPLTLMLILPLALTSALALALTSALVLTGGVRPRGRRRTISSEDRHQRRRRTPYSAGPLS